MRIVVIGTGYVGLVSGACLVDFGHDMTCVDTDSAKIAKLDGSSGLTETKESGSGFLSDCAHASLRHAQRALHLGLRSRSSAA